MTTNAGITEVEQDATRSLLMEVLSIIKQTDPEHPSALENGQLSGADVVQCLCELEARIEEALGLPAEDPAQEQADAAVHAPRG